MTRTRKAALGFGSDVGGQVLVTLGTFVATPLFLDFTSQSLFGFWIASLSFLAYLGLVEFGINISLTREVAAASAQNEEERISRAYNTAFYCLLIMGICIFVAGMCIAPKMPIWFSIAEEEEARQVIATFRWAILATSLALPLGIFRSVLNGLQHLMIGNFLGTIGAISCLAASVFFLYMGWGLQSLGIGLLIQTALGGSLSWVLVRSRVPYLRLGLPRIYKGTLKRLWVFGGYFQLGKIAYSLSIASDTVFIGVMLGAAAVTPYALTAKLPILFTAALASKLPLSLFPAMSQMFGGGEFQTLRRVVIGLTQYSTRIAVIGSLILFFGNQKFVTLWVGPEQFGGFWLNIVFVTWILFEVCLRGLGTVVNASGDLRTWAYAHIIEAAMSIALMLYLIPILGIVGAALGTSISRFMVMGSYLPLAVCRRTGLTFGAFLLEGIGLTLLRSSPGIIMTICYAALVPASESWTWVVGLCLIVCISNFIAFEGVSFLGSSGQPIKQRLSSLIQLPNLKDRAKDSS